MAGSPRSLLYVGGHPLFRDALAVALAAHGFALEPAPSVLDAVDALDADASSADRAVPSGALIDDDTLGEDLAVEALAALPRKLPGLLVGVVATTRSALFPARAVQAGAGAFFTKDTPLDELVIGIDRFLQGQLVVDPVVARTVFAINSANAAHAAGTGSRSSRNRDRHEPHLTPVERRVLNLAAEGLLVKQIALELGLSPLTVKNHLARIRARLGATDKAHAVATAIRTGLLD